MTIILITQYNIIITQLICLLFLCLLVLFLSQPDGKTGNFADGTFLFKEINFNSNNNNNYYSLYCL